MNEELNLEEVKQHISSANHYLDQDPDMHPDDRPFMWIQGYGYLSAKEHISLLLKKVEQFNQSISCALDRLERATKGDEVCDCDSVFEARSSLRDLLVEKTSD